MLTFTEEEQALKTYVDGLTPENGTLEFDLTDDKQYQYAVMMTKKHFDTERYPGKIAAIDLQKQQQEESGFVSVSAYTDTSFANMFKIPGLAIDPVTNLIASNGLGTAAGGYANLSLILTVQDRGTHQVIASGQTHGLAGTVLQVASSPVGSGGTSTNVQANMFYLCSPKSGTPFSGQTNIVPSYQTLADPVLTQPVAYCTQPWVAGAINIGLGRPWNDQTLGVNFDYVWSEPTQSNPIGKIPFVGSVTFNQPIAPLAAGANFIVQIYVANQTFGGGVTLDATNLSTVYNGFSIDQANGAKLNWSLPAGINIANPGNPITFGNLVWPSDASTIFSCQILVQLKDGTWGSANIISQIGGIDPNPLDGTLVIKPISFVWHCLAENTLIDMADGTKKPIGAIVAGDTVITNDTGEVSKVNYTNKGMHLGEVLLLKADNGLEVTTSHNHVFKTLDGFTPASEICIGAFVQTNKGYSKITEIEKIADYEGMFYNLATQSCSQKSALGTFIANGFQVGDITAQRKFRDFQANDIAWVKRQVPAYLHMDVDSFFEEKNEEQTLITNL